jgi:glycosyltransferase involved in cell wall biosynthesis
MNPTDPANGLDALPASPLVSVIMPVLNGQKYIAEAIQSISAQTYRNIELVVVDDGSTDGTAEIVHSFSPRLRIEYVRHEECRGIARSMNDGIRHAHGALIAFLDHDDAWMPTFLETQLAHLKEHPEAGMVHCDVQTMDAAGNVIEPSVAECRNRGIEPSGYIFPHLFLRSLICGNSVLIRRECFERLGLFDESLRWGDYHMWLRISRHYPIHYVPKTLAKYRQHGSQSTRVTAACRPDQDSVGLMVIKKILAEFPEARKELGTGTIQRRIAALYFDMGYAWWRQGDARNARACVSRAIRYHPLRARHYVQYAATLLPLAKVLELREQWRKLRGLFGQRNQASEHLERVWRSEVR